MTKAIQNRESWLEAAIIALDKKFFNANGYDLPEKLQVSCGFPRASSGKAIGQCWNPSSSTNKTTHMFICPSIAEPIQVLAILLHEMIHAAVGTEAGHRGPFRKLVKEFGLAGKMTATFVEEGGELWDTLCVMRDRLGVYPHAAMIKQRKAAIGTGWIRMRSVTEATYTLTISAKSLDEYGNPVDPWGEEMEIVPRR